MSLLELTGFGVWLGARPLVQDLSFALDRGELLGLIGPNGAGKSTVLKALVGLLPYRGEVRLAGQALARFSAPQRARRLAYLSQDDPIQWPISVADLVGLGRHPYRGSWWRGAGRAHPADRAAIAAALQRTDCWSLRARRITELSGGERARARLARVLAVEAPLILADEPIAALDPRHQLQVMELLRALSRGGTAILLVLHDLTLASRFCDRLLLLDQGACQAIGAPRAVLTAERLRAVYGIDALTGTHGQQDYILPWACTAADTADPTKASP